MDANAGHLDRPPTVFPTVAAQVEGHFDRVTGAEVKGGFVLADVDLPLMAVGYYHYLAGTGFLANNLCLMLRNLGLPDLNSTWSWKRTVRGGDDVRLEALPADELLTGRRLSIPIIGRRTLVRIHKLSGLKNSCRKIIICGMKTQILL